MNRPRVLWIAALILPAVPMSLPAQEAAPSDTATSRPASRLDPAAIFPPDTIAYGELAGPGEQLDKLLKLLADGGIADPVQMLMQRMPPASQPATTTAAAQPAMPMPFAMMLNPSLINEIRKIDGIAGGLTGFKVDERGNSRSTEARFLAVLCPGRSDAIRGIVQMLLGMVTKAAEPHGTAMLYRIGDGPAMRAPYAAVTPQAILVGMPKKMVTDALDRLDKPPSESLLTQERFQTAVGPNRKDAALMVYADVDGLLRSLDGAMPRRDRNEFAKVQQLLGLGAIDRACVRYWLTSDGIAGEMSVSLKEGQTCAVYDLIRTPPADRSLLTFVPAHAAGACALSLGDGGALYDRIISFLTMATSLDKRANTTTRPTVEEGVAKAEKELGIRIRHDLAANVESIALALLPPDATKPAANNGRRGAAGEAMKLAVVSNAFLVVKVRDAPQFDQTLARLMNAAAARLAKGEDAPAAVATEEPVDGGVIRVYAVPRSPVVPVVARVDRTYVLAVSRATVQAALAAHAGTGPNITAGGLSQAALTSVPERASKIVMLRPDLLAGLAFRLHAAANPQGPLPALPAMQPITAYTLEDDRSLIVHGELRDLPKMIAAAMQLRGLAPSTRPAPDSGSN